MGNTILKPGQKCPKCGKKPEFSETREMGCVCSKCGTVYTVVWIDETELKKK